MEPPDRDLLDRVERAIDQESGLLARARGLSTRSRVALAAAMALMVPLLVLVAWPRVDLSVYPQWRLAGEMALLALAGALALWMALRPLHLPPLPRGAGAGLLAGATAAVLLLALLPAAHQSHPASLVGGGDDLAKRALACLMLGLVLSLPILLACWLLERRGHVVTSAVTAAGLAGVVGLQLHCPIVTNVHLVAGHATVVFALMVLTIPLLRRT